jgi:hypothetical protein
VGKISFKIIQESCGLGDTKNSNFISQNRKSNLPKFDAAKAGLIYGSKTDLAPPS